MKTYIISGSSSGIGRDISQNLLDQGHQVIGLARHHDKFTPDTDRYHPYRIDFADIKSLEPLLKTIKSDLKQLDGIICCAGYGHFGEVEQFSVAQMQNIMNVNFLSQAILIKTFVSQLKAQQAGHVIVIGSEAALNGAKKGSLYCASKFALRGFTQSLRQECKQANIAVSLINPGFVNTPFFENLNFAPACSQNNAIQVERISELTQLILSTPDTCVYEEINLQPMQKNLQFKQ